MSNGICSAQCESLQKGSCPYRSIDEIRELLDQTDWDDEDKGDILMSYIMEDEHVKNRIKE